MEEIFINTIQDFNDYQGVETLHPLVSVAHVENTSQCGPVWLRRGGAERLVGSGFDPGGYGYI